MSTVQTITSDLLPVVTVIIGICVPVVTVKVFQWLGVSIDAQHRSALDAAIEAALNKIVALSASGVASVRNTSPGPYDYQAGVASVVKDAPKSVRYLRLTDADIVDRLKTHLVLAHEQRGSVVL